MKKIILSIALIVGLAAIIIFALNFDTTKARIFILETKCNIGDSGSCNDLGNLYVNAKIEEKAIKFYSKSCEMNNAWGCAILGRAPTTKDEEANNFFEKAYKLASNLDTNDAWNYAALGFLYEFGKVVERDNDKSYRFFLKACSLDNAMGCYMAGKSFISYFDPSDDDYKKASIFFQTACDLGNAEGCERLGSWYELGWGGIKEDDTKAMELYRRACDLGNTEGCTELGDNYARGHGVRQDYKKAMEFYGKACDLGYQKGCDKYKEIKLNP